MDSLEIEFEKVQNNLQSPKKKGIAGIIDQHVLPRVKNIIEEDDSVKKLLSYPALVLWLCWFLVVNIVNIY